jgi:hypothetical protein
MMGVMTGQPASPGQAAFGTIQEVVRIDPTTDWATVNISALPEHPRRAADRT